MKQATGISKEMLQELRQEQTRPVKATQAQELIAGLASENKDLTFEQMKHYHWGIAVKQAGKKLCNIWLKTTAYRVTVSEKTLLRLSKETEKVLSNRTVSKRDEVFLTEFVIFPDEIKSLLEDLRFKQEEKQEEKQEKPVSAKQEKAKTGKKKAKQEK